MTVRIRAGAPNRETQNAELLKKALLASEPGLKDPAVELEILYSLPLPGRQIDLVILYHDTRNVDLQLKTSKGVPIHSFVLVIEVKQHSPDLVRFQGPSLQVRYDGQWHDATDQCDAQMWALKRYQKATYHGRMRRQTFVQRAIWLPRVPGAALEEAPASSSVPVHYAEAGWQEITEKLEVNRGAVKTLVDHEDPTRHSLRSLSAHLTHEVRPTRLDLRRMNSLTQTRFDAEKSAYIINLGNGLLMLRGRGGTGKTFALVQIALHLARKGMRTVLLTYNHGLIADVSRALRLIAQEHPDLGDALPLVQTRYSFIQELYEQTFGSRAEREARATVPLDNREAYRLDGLLNHKGAVRTEFDFVLVDEGQDWTEPQRNLLYKLFTPNRVVVADGVDQFVGQSRCKWDNPGVPMNRRHGLRASRRTKGATCQTVSEIARELGISDWDLEPDPEAFGGRFTVIIEPEARHAVSRALRVLELDQRKDQHLRAVDNLICLPSSKMAHGFNYSALFDRAIDAVSGDSWRGFCEEDRRIYPLRHEQLRAIQYHSCRGMEGWTTICFALDQFFDFQKNNPLVDAKVIEAEMRSDLYFDRKNLEARLRLESRMFAINWLMIPLTRSIDHLVVHLTSDSSELAKVLRNVSDRRPGSIEWMSTA
nr:AAA family ATPase [uncultured Sphingomonas sp.]